MEELDKWNPMAEDFHDQRINSYREGVGQDLQNRDTSDVEKKRNGVSDGYKPVSLYVKNIPLELDERVLENLFLQQGKVISVKIPEVNPENVQRFKSKIGFVTMENAKGAQEAIEQLDGFRLKDKILGVSVKLSKEEIQKKKDAQARNEMLLAMHTSGRMDGDAQQSVDRVHSEGAVGRPNTNATARNSAPGSSDLQVTLQNGSVRRVHDHPGMGGGRPVASLAPSLPSTGARGRGDFLNSALPGSTGSLLPPPSVIGSDDGMNVCATCRRPASQRCQACKSVYYCSVACQTQHWPLHKKICVYEQRVPAAPVNKAPLLPEPDFANMEVDVSAAFINNNKEYLKEWLIKNDAAQSESSSSSGGQMKQRPVFHSPNKGKPRNQGQRMAQRDPRQEATKNAPPQPPTNNRPPQSKTNFTTPRPRDQGGPEQPEESVSQARRENKPGYFNTHNSQQGGNNRLGPQKKSNGGSGSERVGKEGGPQQRKGGDQSGGFQKDGRDQRQDGRGQQPDGRGQKPDGRDQRQKDGQFAGPGKKQGSTVQDKGNNNNKRGEPAGEKGGDRNKQRAGPRQQEGASKSPPKGKSSPFVSSPQATGTNIQAEVSSRAAALPVKSSPSGGASSQKAVAQHASSFSGSDLELNKQIQVVVSHIDSPQSFWVQEVEQFKEVMTSIAQVMQLDDDMHWQMVSDVSVGQKFFCEFMGEPARCRVEKVSGKSVTIFYLDFGNSEVTQVSKLLPLPAGIAELPSLAIHCSLQVLPAGGNHWPEEVLEQMKQVFTEAVCYMTPVRRIGTILEVELVHTSGDLNATEFLIKRSLGLPPISPAAAVPAPVAPTRTMASSLGNKKDDLSVGQRVDLVIVDTSSPMDIFTRISSLEPHFNNLSEKMEADYNASPDVPYKPVVGELVVCRFSANRSWYRANVLEVTESTGQATLLYIDFGNSETLAFSEVRAVKPEYASVPIHGFHSALGGFKPPGGQWSEDHTHIYAACLQKYLMEQENNYPKCTVIVETIGSGEEGVVWVDMVKEGLQMTLSEDLSQQLDGSHLPQPLQPSVVTPTESVPSGNSGSPSMPVLSSAEPDTVGPKTSTASPKASGSSAKMSVTPPRKPVASGTESSPKQNQTVGALSPATTVPPLASPQKECPPLLLKKSTLQLDVSVACGIQEIISCQEFYINLKDAEEELDALREKLNQFCSRTVDEDGPQPLKTVALNDLVLVQYSADNEWYRGRVDRILDNGKSCQVFFLDYGNMEVKDVAELKALPQNLRAQPAQAIACKLAGVMAPVSPQVEAHFKTACLQTEVTVKARGMQGDTYIVEVVTADDRSVITDILEVQSVGRRGVARSNKPAAAPTSEELPALTPVSPVAQDTVPQSELERQQHVSPAVAASPKAGNAGVLMRDALQQVVLTAGLNAMVTHVVTPHHFYIITLDQNLAQHGPEGLVSELLTINTPQKSLEHIPVVGELLCGLFYGQWYRCEVLEMMLPKVRVIFFDYGNEEVLDLSDLAALPRDLCNKYPLATFRCCLLGIKPRTDDGVWDEETNQLTKRLLENQELSVVIKSQQGEDRHVSLSDPSSGEDVGQMLIDCDKALAVNVEESQDGGDGVNVMLNDAAAEVGIEGTPVDKKPEINPTKEAILRQMEALQAQLAALQ